MSKSQSTASLKIKNHLATKGTQPVILTEGIVIRWWNLLNRAVFDNELQNPITIDFVAFEREHAWILADFNTRRVNLLIQPNFPTRRLFLEILVHEMVHAWECEHFKRIGHGKRFKQWKPKIWQAIQLPLKEEYE